MKILFVSNFYPPHCQGGYEEWCQEVAEGLACKGHQVLVLTSRHDGCKDGEKANLRIVRRLYLEMELVPWRNGLRFLVGRNEREESNRIFFRQQADLFEPDVIVIWGMWNINRLLPASIETRYPSRTVYYFGDYWPTLPSQWLNYWQAPGRNIATGLLKRILRPPATYKLRHEVQPSLRFCNALFPSQYMQREFEKANVKVGTSRIVYGGVDTFPYCRAPEKSVFGARCKDVLRLLVVGRLVPEKGIHTAIEALSLLTHEYGLRDLQLSIVGDGDREYIARLKRLISGLKVEKQVTFWGRVPKSKMPGLYHAHDIFIFPSVWPEPFGRVLIEAMAAGLPVVSSRVGGAAEIVRDGETGLTFPPGDASTLACQVNRIAQDPILCSTLACQGQHSAVSRFDVHFMVDAIEQYLNQLVTQEESREYVVSHVPGHRTVLENTS